MIELFRSLFEMLKGAFSLKKPESVRVDIAEDKRPGRQQKESYGMFKRAWRFVRGKNRIERKAKRKALEDDLKAELSKIYKE